MKKRDQFNKHWDQMVGVYCPEKEGKPYWEDRCIQQLKIAGEYAKYSERKFEECVETTSTYVQDCLEKQGYITEAVCIEVEERLKAVAAHIKKINVHCVSHAHIDMNWMWGYHETVEVVLATLGTMVQLLKEYPEFTFSQSQASVYKIVEEFDPELLEEIKYFVQLGRWEVTVSTWVEHDKNMTGSESFVRQLLYSREYLSRLLEIAPDSIKIGFEPDTFGHSAYVPEILTQAGVQYYYHCRGLDDQYLYKWVAPSGASLLAYCEPVWYGNSISTGAFCHIPMLSARMKTQDTLFVYGVGDHGGGPTRQDIERIQEMRQWPLMPNLLFSRYSDFFEAVEGVKESLPVVEGEINPLFTGCYTSTSRIKMANKYGENSLVSTEFSATMAKQILGQPYPYKQFEASWEKHLFNQFHDILPGCGIDFTMEYAMGEFQKIIASNNVIKRKALEGISSCIDTTAYGVEQSEKGTAESAGHGVDLRKVMDSVGISYSTGITQRGRFSGGVRAFALYNHTQYPREEQSEIVLWDYKEPLEALAVYGSDGQNIPFVVEEADYSQYWGHWFIKLIVEVEVPAFGYEVICISNDADYVDASMIKSDPRKHDYAEYVLENDFLKVAFDVMTMDIVSIYSKEEQRELLANKGANFRFIKEESKGASAWTIGEYISKDDCKKEVIERTIEKNKLFSRITFKMKLNTSVLNVCYTLSKTDKHIHVNLVNRWNEIGNDVYTPQLQFELPLNQECSRYLFDVPMGLIERTPLADDLPGLNFAYAYQYEKNNLYIGTDSKYGYRGTEDTFALTIVRSSTGPNTHPDNDTHYTDFIIGVGDVGDAYRQSAFLNMPLEGINISVNQKGTLPLKASFMEVEATTSIVTSVKQGQNEEGVIVKLYQPYHKDEVVSLKFKHRVEKGFLVDVLENNGVELEKATDHSVTFVSKAKTMSIVKIMFADE